jgi:HK97 gp10 family phage protein
MITLKFDDHSQVFLNALEEQVPIALEACGYRAEELAVGYCPVDTGLLRNSITFALDGQTPKKKAYKSDSGSESGKYQGQAQKEKSGKRAVIIGTNVEYAVYVEAGTSRMRKQPFLAPAIKDHTSDYVQICEKYLKG